MSVTEVARDAGRPITIGRAVSDAAVLTRRNLLRIARTPQLVVFSTIQPIMFVLLFAFVFGGAISIPGVDNYIDFLMAGIFVQTAVFGSTNTGIGLTEDLRAGIIDRFRSLPMARSAVLAGRTFSDAVRNLFVIFLMLIVAFIIGFRFHGGLGAAIGALLIVLAFGYSFSWVAAVLGLAAKTPEAAQAASFIPLFPLVFASSAFVPTDTMPDWLQVFAEHQPVTAVVNVVRALILGLPTGDLLWRAALWIVIIFVVFAPLAVRMYRRSAE